MTCGMPCRGGDAHGPIVWEDWHLQGLDSHEDDRPRALSLNGSSGRRTRVRAGCGTLGLLATHHPLVAIDCPWLDKDRIIGPLELMNWLHDAVTSVARCGFWSRPPGG